MAKDPATLWYWNDWHSGTILMSRFLKGCYMDLLHAQFNHGPLSLEEVKAVLGSDFGQTWPSLVKKFNEKEGRFFNERMEQEKEKRKKHSEHQRRNAKKRWDKSDGICDGIANAHASSMPLENESENRNEIIKYKIEECLIIALKDSRFVKSNKTNDYELHRFNEYLEQQGKYSMNPLDYKTYFAKLKGKYPAMLKKEMTVEELREIAKKMDQHGITSGV